MIGKEPKDVKTNYSKEVLTMLDDIWIKESLAKAINLRGILGFETNNNVLVINNALKSHNRAKIKLIKSKIRRGLINVKDFEKEISSVDELNNISKGVKYNGN